jgi:hypothetical protein
VIARALNGGDFARAAIAAVLTRTSELSCETAARLATADDELTKYNADEPRDWRGRWTTDEGAGSVNITAPAGEGAARQGVDLIRPRYSDPEQGADDRDGSPTPVLSPSSEDVAADDDSREPTSLEQAFEREYDSLGPVEFANQVIQFGYRLERDGRNLSPAEKERALAEYTFLQGRLTFWLGYEYTPPMAHGNLLSAALSLYQDAVNGRIVKPGHLPRSMLDVAAGVWALDNLPQARSRTGTKPAAESAPLPVEAPKEVEELGGIVDNGELKIKWNESIKDQGGPFEDYVGRQNPDAKELPPTSKTFDKFDSTTGEAISAKTLNTLSVSYITNPQRIYWRLKRYADAAADYEPRAKFDLEPSKIESRRFILRFPNIPPQRSGATFL